jgi:hypothetical protein
MLSCIVSIFIIVYTILQGLYIRGEGIILSSTQYGNSYTGGGVAFSNSNNDFLYAVAFTTSSYTDYSTNLDTFQAAFTGTNNNYIRMALFDQNFNLLVQSTQVSIAGTGNRIITASIDDSLTSGNNTFLLERNRQYYIAIRFNTASPANLLTDNSNPAGVCIQPKTAVISGVDVNYDQSAKPAGSSKVLPATVASTANIPAANYVSVACPFTPNAPFLWINTNTLTQSESYPLTSAVTAINPHIVYFSQSLHVSSSSPLFSAFKLQIASANTGQINVGLYRTNVAQGRGYSLIASTGLVDLSLFPTLTNRSFIIPFDSIYGEILLMPTDDYFVSVYAATNSIQFYNEATDGTEQYISMLSSAAYDPSSQSFATRISPYSLYGGPVPAQNVTISIDLLTVSPMLFTSWIPNFLTKNHRWLDYSNFSSPTNPNNSTLWRQHPGPGVSDPIDVPVDNSLAVRIRIPRSALKISAIPVAGPNYNVANSSSTGCLFRVRMMGRSDSRPYSIGSVSLSMQFDSSSAAVSSGPFNTSSPYIFGGALSGFGYEINSDLNSFTPISFLGGQRDFISVPAGSYLDSDWIIGTNLLCDSNRAGKDFFNDSLLLTYLTANYDDGPPFLQNNQFLATDNSAYSTYTYSNIATGFAAARAAAPSTFYRYVGGADWKYGALVGHALDYAGVTVKRHAGVAGLAGIQFASSLNRLEAFSNSQIVITSVLSDVPISSQTNPSISRSNLVTIGQNLSFAFMGIGSYELSAAQSFMFGNLFDRQYSLQGSPYTAGQLFNQFAHSAQSQLHGEVLFYVSPNYFLNFTAPLNTTYQFYYRDSASRNFSSVNIGVSRQKCAALPSAPLVILTAGTYYFPHSQSAKCASNGYNYSPKLFNFGSSLPPAFTTTVSCAVDGNWYSTGILDPTTNSTQDFLYSTNPGGVTFPVLQPQCIDRDECSLSSSCPSNSACFNTIGSYQCGPSFQSSVFVKSPVSSGTKVIITINTGSSGVPFALGVSSRSYSDPLYYRYNCTNNVANTSNLAYNSLESLIFGTNFINNSRINLVANFTCILPEVVGNNLELFLYSRPSWYNQIDSPFSSLTVDNFTWTSDSTAFQPYFYSNTPNITASGISILSVQNTAPQQAQANIVNNIIQAVNPLIALRLQLTGIHFGVNPPDSLHQQLTSVTFGPPSSGCNVYGCTINPGTLSANRLECYTLEITVGTSMCFIVSAGGLSSLPSTQRITYPASPVINRITGCTDVGNTTINCPTNGATLIP